jgi:hypothetical protein
MTRATREQVEDTITDALHEKILDHTTVEAICRDWLDMQERERRLVAVVEAVDSIVGDDGMMFEYDVMDMVMMTGGEFRSRLSALRHAYRDATTDGAVREDG